MLPGWYGAGSAFEEWAGGSNERLAWLQHLHARWPFLRSVLSNMGMVLAKTDLSLARRYVALASDAESAVTVFARIEAEHARSVDWVRRITGAGLLADNPAMARSIRNRFPYLDPLNVLQAELLRRFRSGDDGELTRTSANFGAESPFRGPWTPQFGRFRQVSASFGRFGRCQTTVR